MSAGSERTPKDWTDSWGRTHTYLRISLTEQCNFQCAYCLPPEGLPDAPPPAHHLLDEEILTLARIFVAGGVRKIRFTGGEPLLRAGAARLAARTAQELSVPVHLTTNGSLLPRHLPTLVAGGIAGINISLDTMDREHFARITKRDVLPVVLRAAEAVAATNIQLKLNAVVTPDYALADAMQLIQFARELGAEMRFIEFMPLCGSAWQINGSSRAQELEAEIVRELGLEQRCEGEVAHTFSHSDTGQRVGFIRSLSQPFCGTCNRLRLSCDGRLLTCLFSRQGRALLPLLRAGASEAELRTAIAEEVLQKTRAHGRNNPVDFQDPAVTSAISGVIHSIGG